MSKMKNIFWIYSLSALTYFIQGWEGLPGLAIFRYFKEILMYSPEKIMFIGSLVSLSWIPKILWGYLSDQFLTKKFWIFISIIFDIITALIVGIWILPILILITMEFVNSTDSAIRDVNIDGIMCIEGKKFNITGKIQSIQWISITIASIITGILGGYIADHYSYRVGFLLLIPFYLLLFIPLFFYKEEKVNKKRIKFIETIKPYKRIFTNKSFLVVCLFIFLYNYSPSFGTPLSYIQRDKFNWSFQFMGILGSITSVISIFGALVYYKICQKINIKKWLYYSVFLGAITTLSYLYYTPISAILYSIIYSFIGMAIHLMVMDFMSKSTINGLESTTFALLCGIHNLAATMSSLTGAWLYPILGLNILIIISALTSFICLPLIKYIK